MSMNPSCSCIVRSAWALAVSTRSATGAFRCAACTRRTSWAGETPSEARTRIVSTWPGLSMILWAVRRSKTAIVAPDVPTSASCTRPAMRYRAVGWFVATPMLSPMPTRASEAVKRSMATSPLRGQRPEVRRTPVRPGAGTERPSLGGPSTPSAAPLRSIRVAVPSTSPPTDATPGMLRIESTRRAGTAGVAVSRSAERTASLPLTITSEPRSAWVNQLSNPRVAVEVSTSVAHTIAVPNTIARAVSTVRSLRVTMPRSARRFTSAPSCGRGSRPR